MSNEAYAFVASLDLGDMESAATRLLLQCIAHNTFNDTFVCRLEQSQLAYETRMSVRSVRRHLAAFERARVVIRAKRRSLAHGQAMPDLIRLRGFKRWYLRDHASLRRRWEKAEKPPAANLAAGPNAGAASGQFGRRI